MGKPRPSGVQRAGSPAPSGRCTRPHHPPPGPHTLSLRGAFLRASFLGAIQIPMAQAFLDGLVPGRRQRPTPGPAATCHESQRNTNHTGTLKSNKHHSKNRPGAEQPGLTHAQNEILKFTHAQGLSPAPRGAVETESWYLAFSERMRWL